MEIVLDVAYKERHIAKKLGAKWSPEQSAWYYSGESIPVALLGYIKDIKTTMEKSKAISLEKFSEAQISIFNELDACKTQLYKLGQSILHQIDKALPIESKAYAMKIIEQTIIPKDNLANHIRSSITNAQINDFVNCTISKRLKCSIKQGSAFSMQLKDGDDTNKVTKSYFWVANEDITFFTKSTKQIIDNKNTFIATITKEAVDYLIEYTVNFLESRVRDKFASKYDFLLAIDANTIDVPTFLKNGKKANVFGHVISLTEGRKTIDINGSNIHYSNGNLAVKLYELDSVRQFSTKLLKHIDQYCNRLCNEFISSNITSVYLESGMWVATNNLNIKVKGFAQRGQWFIDTINGISINQNSAASKKLVSIIKKQYTS